MERLKWASNPELFISFLSSTYLRADCSEYENAKWKNSNSIGSMNEQKVRAGACQIAKTTLQSDKVVALV